MSQFVPEDQHGHKEGWFGRGISIQLWGCIGFMLVFEGVTFTKGECL